MTPRGSPPPHSTQIHPNRGLNLAEIAVQDMPVGAQEPPPEPLGSRWQHTARR